jgi:hypothetical protein
VKKVVKQKSKAYRRRRSKKDQNKWLPYAIGASFVIVVGLLVYNSLRKPGTDEPGPRAYEALFGVKGTSISIGETAFLYPDPGELGDGQKWLPALGEPNAPVTMIEFSDIFCNHCRNFNLDNLEGILEDYVATGKVRYVDHYFGFGDSQQIGALDAMLCAAEQGHYYEFKHALFQSIEVNAFDLNRTARITGLDVQRYNECMSDGRYKAAIQEMVYDDNSGVNVTPSFFINGQKVEGNNPVKIRAMIEEALINSGN